MKKRRHGFTLVELLVVIGIIALLISILLPALGKAKKAANAAKCLANLHSIGNAMRIYATNNNDYIPGSPNTSGAFLIAPGSPYGNGNSPGTVAIFDWMSPLVDAMGFKIPYSSTADAGRSNGQARWDRVNFQLHSPMFQCPENQAVCTLYQGSTAFPGVSPLPGFVPYLSYCSSMMTMVENNPTSGDTSNPTTMGNAYANPPAGYSPKLSRLGSGANKIFVSDGARYILLSGGDFDMDFSYNGSVGGAYADWGAYTTYANGRPRTGPTSSLPDSRPYWERHGGNTPGTYKFNAVFYDGHATALGDLEGSNPNLWCPKGTVIARTEFWPDTLSKYVSGPGNYIVGD
jgi:prepilin-type N-terminal cleavage/methylation domain-containing protein